MSARSLVSARPCAAPPTCRSGDSGENGGTDEAETKGEESDDAESEGRSIDPGFGAFLRARAINQALFDANADEYPGGFIRFLSVTDDSVSIRRVWRHGLAIGVRGLTLAVDKKTGEIVQAGVMIDHGGEK